jgi:hypothetical protein
MSLLQMQHFPSPTLDMRQRTSVMGARFSVMTSESILNPKCSLAGPGGCEHPVQHREKKVMSIVLAAILPPNLVCFLNILFI